MADGDVAAGGGPAAETDGAAAPSVLTAQPPPLFDRIGGMKSLINAVDVFYDMVLADPMLAPFFEGVDQGKQRIKQVRIETRREGFLFLPWPARCRRSPRQWRHALVTSGSVRVWCGA
jgi:hypothetical protein